MVSVVRADLFTAPDFSSLAHCISRDCKLGAGIAFLFRQRFGRIGELREMCVKVGGVAPLRVGNRFVYNLVTKERYFSMPTYDSLRESLLCMREHSLLHGVTEICMPQIGCGLDGLIWTKVKGLLDEIFHDVDINVTVYVL